MGSIVIGQVAERDSASRSKRSATCFGRGGGAAAAAAAAPPPPERIGLLPLAEAKPEPEAKPELAAVGYP